MFLVWGRYAPQVDKGLSEEGQNTGGKPGSASGFLAGPQSLRSS